MGKRAIVSSKAPSMPDLPDFSTRTSGLLLHPTSLPSRHGSGDLGAEARAFADFLAAAGQRWWQMLPVGPPGAGPGYSPYSSYTALGGSPWLISLDGLVADGLLTRADVKPVGGLDGKLVDFGRSIAFREPRLRKAFDTALAGKRSEDGELGQFIEENRHWLDDLALFSAIKERYAGKPWDQWDRGLRLRDPKAMAEARRDLSREMAYHQFLQFVFDRQWRALRRYCHDRGIGLIGDIPIFVAHDSADVWAHRELFDLEPGGRPCTVTGCPPDAYAKDGQLWGHPQYRWEAHKKTRFAWWVGRFAASMRYFDAVRIDHFLGFHRAWAIPGRARTARKGEWVAGPREAIFEAVKRDIGDIPVIAEDLGRVTPEATALRERFGFPGMKVLQFGFAGEPVYLPHAYVRNCVAYTGTHDNNTSAGWFKALPRDARQDVLDYLGSTPATVADDMIRAVMSSVANTAIFPVQDVLGLGAEARMNIPGVAEGNWRWRVPAGALNRQVAGRLRRLAELAERI